MFEKRGAGTSLHLFLLADVENKPFLLFNGALKERLDAIMQLPHMPIAIPRLPLSKTHFARATHHHSKYSPASQSYQ
ncbi:hypothetical protein P4V43_25260 [Brevibacillus fortis]|uniref:hypothetical protein n=1 Tax=Brevibacillus fortis TaxID=2126352 RepID=UPI002E222013|nr:hypothetical protein [Brevibacillus fortis]